MPKEPAAATEQVNKIYEHLKKVRTSTTVEIKPTHMLRDEIKGFDGQPEPLKVRYYQVQGIYHLLMVNRMILGDGTGLGKTLEAVAALCYIWERDPDVKVMVVCPKSAIGQWESEIDRFTTGIKCFQATGSIEKRKAAYLAWYKHIGPSVLIVNYHGVVRDWDQGITKEPPPPGSKPGTTTVAGRGFLDALTSKVPKLSLIMDECFDYHTPILLADGTTDLLGRIVTKKVPVEVMSWNWETQKVESKTVVRWFRNPLLQASRKTLLKIKFRFAGTTNVTRAHKFYQLNGSEIPAGSLKKGSYTTFLTSKAPSRDQEQVVLGSLLGDACISHPNRCAAGVCFGQSTKQELWVEFKRDLLNPLGVSGLSRYQTELQSGSQQMVRFRLNANPYLASLFSEMRIRSENKKRVTVEWLDRIDPLGLAVWYADDGSLSEHTCLDGTITRYITLNTQGYTREENELLAGWLRWKWGVHAVVKLTKNKKRGSQYYTLYLDKVAASRFLELLPCSFPGVEYKFPLKTVYRASDFEQTPRQVLVRDEVLSVGSWVSSKNNPRLKNQYVYNIEVEGNHNYFANGSLVSNCTAVKNPGTKTHQTCKFLADRAKRVWGLTATLLQNHLIEGFGIYKVIRPQTFGTKNSFLNIYCITEMQRVKGGGRIPIIVGYRNLDHFRQTIDPFFYGRPKHLVSKELPSLTTREVVCELSAAEDRKYAEALSGIFKLGTGEVKDYQETKQLTSLIYIQEVCNSLTLLKYDSMAYDTYDESVPTRFERVIGKGKEKEKDSEGRSAKESALASLLTEEFDGEKVIVYTRFASHIDRLKAILAKEGIHSVVISGAVNKASDRKVAQDKFQDPKSKVKVIFITDAGSESINLQSAAAMIFFDTPWSWGRYVQLLGRMIRIGSPHQKVLAIHLLAKRPGLGGGKKAETIDHKVIQKLRKKKGLIDQVIGEAAVGALKFERDEDSIRDLVRSLIDSSRV